jgi:hypothetical protein
MRWITVGPADQPGTSIVLYPPFAAPGITDDERRTIVEMMAKGTYAIIVLATADLDGTFERVQASEAEVVQEPTEQSYGVRDCAFRDPPAASSASRSCAEPSGDRSQNLHRRHREALRRDLSSVSTEPRGRRTHVGRRPRRHVPPAGLRVLLRARRTNESAGALRSRCWSHERGRAGQ